MILIQVNIFDKYLCDEIIIEILKFNRLYFGVKIKFCIFSGKIIIFIRRENGILYFGRKYNFVFLVEK